MSQLNKPKLRYDLEERTAKFGENIINFCKVLKADAVPDQLLVNWSDQQLVLGPII